MTHVLVTGGTGFVGGYLCPMLLDAGYRVTALGTRKNHPLEGKSDFRYLRADASRPGPWQEAVREVDAVVNLAGRTISQRWTKTYKEAIYHSRIDTTQNVVAAIDERRPPVLISTSAVGYYGDRKEAVVTEQTPAGSDFLSRVSLDWEAAALAAKEKGSRVAITRFGMVLGKGGGALEKMIPAFKMMVGGPMGDGRQWISWIHVADVIAGIRFLLEHPEAEGPFNFTAPNPERNGDFARALGAALKRPAILPAPMFMIRAALGEMAGMLLTGQRCIPGRLTELGYRFRYPELAEALADIVQKEEPSAP